MGKEMKRTEQRDEILKKVVDFLSKEYDADIRFTGSGEIMMPAVDENGEEYYFKFKASIPRGKRSGDGSYVPYDGYEAAQMWQYTLDDRAEKKRASEEKAAMKEKEKIRKAEAKKVVKKLNTVGFNAMVHEEGE